MELMIELVLTIAFFSVLIVPMLKLSTKSELKENYEKPIPNDLIPASESEKDLFRTKFILLGTRKGSKYTTGLIQEYLLSLFVSHGVIEKIENDFMSCGDSYHPLQKVTINTGDISYTISNILPLDKTYVGCKVLSFYSKDHNGNFVYRYAVIE